MTGNAEDKEIGFKEISIPQKEDDHPHSSPVHVIIEHAKETVSDTFKKNLPQNVLDHTPDNCKYIFCLRLVDNL